MIDQKAIPDKSKNRVFSLLARQIYPPMKPLQVFFDLAVGIGLPVLWLYLDPLLFKLHPSPHEIHIWDDLAPGYSGILASYRAAGYGFAGILMLALAAYLFVRRDLGVISGILTAGTTVFTLLSSLLIPFAIVACIELIFSEWKHNQHWLFLLIGSWSIFVVVVCCRNMRPSILTVGTIIYILLVSILIPLTLASGFILISRERSGLYWLVLLSGLGSIFMAFVYFRNAVRSYYGLAIQRISKGTRKKAMVVGILSTLLIPAGAQLYIEALYDGAIERILSGEEIAYHEGIESLKRFSILFPPTWMTREYRQVEREQRDRYADAFTEVYGRDILKGIPAPRRPR